MDIYKEAIGTLLHGHQTVGTTPASLWTASTTSSRASCSAPGVLRPDAQHGSRVGRRKKRDRRLRPDRRDAFDSRRVDVPAGGRSDPNLSDFDG